MPSTHASLFGQDARPSLRMGITSEVALLRALLSCSADHLRKSLAAKPPEQ